MTDFNHQVTDEMPFGELEGYIKGFEQYNERLGVHYVIKEDVMGFSVWTRGFKRKKEGNG